jgi:hypothetical protein
VTSTQTLSDTERRALARWAAACSARVRPLYAADAEHEEQIRDALARALAYGHGESTAAAEIRNRMVAVNSLTVERCTGSSCTNFVPVSSLPGTFTRFSESGLKSSTTFRYRVRVNDYLGRTAVSSIVSIKTR